ncbi:armadillo-type protein [Mycena latifolia]|nr:armadillo-type protein [Mycena latifolia]
MPPLTRQQTFQSVLSWWSDSNPPGGTINLHAAAKPLMKLMYHRQALGFVRRNNGVPLTPETVEIYWSYVAWKYVSSATKIAIMGELVTRAESEEDARVLIDSNIVHEILQLLQSSSFNTYIHWLVKFRSALMLSRLARHSTSARAAIIEPLVALLRTTEVNDGALAFELLSEIASYSSESAEGIVAANVLHYLLDALGSPSTPMRWGACQLTDALARHESTAAAVIELHPCKQLVAFARQAFYASDALVAITNWPDGAEAAVAAQVLEHVPTCDPDKYLVCHAVEALASIANWPDGAEAIVAAEVLDHLTNHLVSRFLPERESTCRLLAALARHESTVQAVTRAVPRERLVALSRKKKEHDLVRESATRALQALDNYLARVQAPGEPTINVLEASGFTRGVVNPL